MTQTPTNTVGALLDALQGLPRDAPVLHYGYDEGTELAEITIEAYVDIVVRHHRPATADRTTRQIVGRGPYRESVLAPGFLIAEPIYHDFKIPGFPGRTWETTETLTAPSIREVALAAAAWEPTLNQYDLNYGITKTVISRSIPALRVTVSA